MFETCDGFENNNCTNVRDDYLKQFGDKYDFSDFCLAYVFTNIDFHNGTAGLAHIGTACYESDPSANTGFVTLFNHGKETPLKESRLTFVHELAHNFGASHDEDIDDSDCAEKGYIMTEVVDVDDRTEAERIKNRRTFSPCSLKAMKSKLVEIKTDRECYVDAPYDHDHEPRVALCGNYVVEDGEECDCGPSYQDCSDSCCYAAHISPADRLLNETAMPCGRHQAYRCLHSSNLIFGIYLPWIVIFIVVIILGICLSRDWKGEKKWFPHITQNRVKIVN